MVASARIPVALAVGILVEFEFDEFEQRLSDPPVAVCDVTDDDRFSGGALAATSDAEAAALVKGAARLRRRC